MTDIFVTRMRNLCNSMSEAIILAHDNEKTARETCSAAHELATDVEIIAKTTHQLEDELTRTVQQIAIIETELLATASRQQKTEKIVGELQAKFARVEKEVNKTRQMNEKRVDKLTKMGDFLEKNRQFFKAGNKGLGQLDEANERFEKELKLAVQEADLYNIKYDEINGRIKTLEGVLKRLTDKSERAEEKAEINSQIIEEKAAAVKETQISNFEASANEDIALERIRELREKLFNAEERFKYAHKKEVEMQAVSNDLSSQYASQKEKYAKLQKK